MLHLTFMDVIRYHSSLYGSPLSPIRETKLFLLLKGRSDSYYVLLDIISSNHWGTLCTCMLKHFSLLITYIYSYRLFLFPIRRGKHIDAKWHWEGMHHPGEGIWELQMAPDILSPEIFKKCFHMVGGERFHTNHRRKSCSTSWFRSITQTYIHVLLIPYYSTAQTYTILTAP